jgi:hypothetical protein
MLRKVRAFDQDAPNIIDRFNSQVFKSGVNQPRSRHIGKRRRQQILLGENYNPNKKILSRTLVSSIKYDTILKRREKKKAIANFPTLSKAQSDNTTSSTSTSYTLVDKAKRREYQGNKIYNKQKGGKQNIGVYKQSLKSQRTDRWKYFNLYNEKELSYLNDFSLHLIDNECDDDCQTDDEVLENGIDYCQNKLNEALFSALQSQVKSKINSD